MKTTRNENNKGKGTMTPYFIRVKGSYRLFKGVPVTRINETFMVKLGSWGDNIDAQNIVSSYITRIAGWQNRLDIYEVEPYEKEMSVPNLYFTINDAQSEYWSQDPFGDLERSVSDPKEMSEDQQEGIKEYIKNCKKVIADDLRYHQLKNGEI